MRLTLRTLLAYLDDTLEAGAASDLGKRVAESPLAQSLIEKIRRDTASRQIGAPPESSGEAILASEVVAAYLDNGLQPDVTQQVEKLALESDLYLAEIASTHQILSANISDSVEVPIGDRNHFKLMGESSTTAKLDMPGEEREAARTAARALASPSRFAPTAAILMLLLVVIGLLVLILLRQPGDDETGGPTSGTPATRPADPKPPATQEQAQPPVAPDTQVAGPVEPPEPPAPTTRVTPPPDTQPVTPPVRVPKPVAGPVATIATSDGVAATFVHDQQNWKFLLVGDRPGRGDRIFSVIPEPVRLDCFNRVRLSLLHRAMVRFDDARDDQSLKLSLLSGWVTARAGVAGASLRLPCRGKELRIEFLDPGTEIDLARVYDWPEGEMLHARVVAHRIVLVLRTGRVRTRIGKNQFQWDKPVQLTWTPMTGLVQDPSIDAGSKPATAISAQVLRRIKAQVRPTRPVRLSLKEACSDSNRVVRQVAGASLLEIGDLQRVVSLLFHDRFDVRQSVVRGLRPYFARRPEQWDPFWQLMDDRTRGQEGEQIRQLLVGYTPQLKGVARTYEQLIALLEDPSSLVRDLAIAQLEAIYGRALNYEADATPAERRRAVRRWQALLQRGELPPEAYRRLVGS